VKQSDMASERFKQHFSCVSHLQTPFALCPFHLNLRQKPCQSDSRYQNSRAK
jgi:hypothetical protein